MSILDIVKAFVPPHPADSEGETEAERSQSYELMTRRWRWKMFAGVVGAWVVILSMVTASFGVFPAVYEGFAKAADQRATQSDVTAIRVEQLEARIFSLRKDMCVSIEAGKGGGVYWEQLKPLLRLYYDLTGQTYQLPECREL